MVDIKYDFVSVGSGAGGLAAAIAVAEAGGSALVVEKDTALGGVTALSGGQVWMGANNLQAQAAIEDTRSAASDYLEFLSDGFADPALRAVYVNDGPEAIGYFTDRIGIPLAIIPEWPDYYYPTAPGSMGAGRFLETLPFESATLGSWEDRSTVGDYTVTSHDRSAAGGSSEELNRFATAHRERGERCAGAALSGHLIKAALDRGVDFLVDTRAVRLTREGGRVVGLTVSDESGERHITARHGVLLATGAYDWNPEHVQTYEQLTGLLSAVPPTVEGDHIVMATELGGAVVSARPSAANCVLYGYAEEQEGGAPPKYGLLIPGNPHSIVVNSRGERFADDSFLPELATAMGRYFGVERGFGNMPAWLVFDQSFREKYGLGTYTPTDSLPDGLVVKADSLAELAEKAQIDPDGLHRTVERFNAFCAFGVDEDFGRGQRKYSRMMTGDVRREPNPNLGELGRPPFYAMDLVRIGVGIPTAGLKIDGDAGVVDVRGKVIPGLYAAGNSAAHMDIGAGYTSGIANARGLVYGYLAATHSMKAASQSSPALARQT